MNAATTPARAVTLALGLLALAACTSQPGDATPKKTDAKAEQAEPTAAEPNEAEPADAKRPDGKRVEITKAHAKTPKDPKTILDLEAAGQNPSPADGDAKKYRRGMVPPSGMSAEDLEKFAVGVGDPTGGKLTLEQAFEGDPTLADESKGKLTATFDTTMGRFECELYEKKAPLTVANFVGLARGVRPTYDKKSDSWVTKKYYDGVIFHRVIKNFMVQTGDDTNTGRGNPGYVILDEFVKGLDHDSAGVLSMANRSEPNTGSTQFFITVRPTKHLDGKHAVFGKCADAKVPIAMSLVKVDHRAGDRPYEQIKINSVTISRK